MGSGGVHIPPENTKSSPHHTRGNIPSNGRSRYKLDKLSQRRSHRQRRASSSNARDESAHLRLGIGGRYKRSWKACERCRMKKSKCDGEFPCKRCMNDSLICTATTRKVISCRKLPKGYAEVLEHTQYTLVETVHKLYTMLRSGKRWDLPEPRLNDRNLPVVHDIAAKLKTTHPHSDIDLPVRNIFPEDDRGLQELQAKIEALEAKNIYGDDTSQYDQLPRPLDKEQLYKALPPSGMKTISSQGSVSDISEFDNDSCVADFYGCQPADLQLTGVVSDYSLDTHRFSTQSRQENNCMSFVSFNDQMNFDINLRCPSLSDDITLQQQDHLDQLRNSGFDEFILMQSNDVSTAGDNHCNSNFTAGNLIGTFLFNQSSMMPSERVAEAQLNYTRDPTLCNDKSWMPEFEDQIAV